MDYDPIEIKGEYWNCVPFGKIKKGCCFIYNGEVYMKVVTPDHCEFRALKIRKAELEVFDPGCPVMYTKAILTLER